MVDFDIDKICRVCLQSNIELSLLFNELNSVDGVCLSDMITECTMYTVERHDDFPHLICDECIEKVRNAYRFKKQFETSHRRLITFLDSVNKVVIDTKFNNTVDKSIQTEETTLYPCEKCEEKFMNYQSLREHRLDSHKGTANLCRICLRTFNRITDLKNHIAISHPEIGHRAHNECSICSKRFTRKDHVMRHMRNVHKIGEAKKKLTTKTEDDSIDKETLLKMKIEYESFTTEDAGSSLASNYDGCNYDDNGSSEVELADTNQFSMDEEDKKSLSALQNLKKPETNDLNTNDHLVKLEPSDNSPLTLESYECQTADYAMGEQPYQKPYQRINNGRYKCTECEKTFSKSSHVKQHFLLHIRHDEERVFPCDCCDRFYDCLEDLQRHKDQMQGAGNVMNKRY